jgi:hypothetical protein
MTELDLVAVIHKDLYMIAGYTQTDINDVDTSVRKPCAFCGGDQMIIVGSARQTTGVDKRTPVRWLRCVSCFRGHVDNDGAISPPVRPLDTPNVLKGEDLAARTEILACLSVGCGNDVQQASFPRCRVPRSTRKGWQWPSAQALEHLEDEGVFTKHMRPWFDKIKKVGKEANHEIPCTSAAEAMDVALSTRQLIRLAYELPAMVAEHTDEGEQDEDSS